MPELNRQELLVTAVAVGLVLGVDFEKSISNINLQKKIEEKQEQLANDLKGVQAENDIENKDNINPLANSESEEEKLFKEEMEALNKVETKVPGIFTDTDEDNALILRNTECFTYRTEIIGFKETARRSNLTVEEVKEAIETGKPVGGYIFEFVG